VGYGRGRNGNYHGSVTTIPTIKALGGQAPDSLTAKIAICRDLECLRAELDVVRSIFYIQESLHEVDRKWVTAEVETATIMVPVGLDA
jgi:hypothetical protein